MYKKTSSFLKKNSLLFFILWAFWLSFYFLFLVRVHDNADGNLPLSIALKNNIFNYGYNNWAQFVAGGTDLLSLNSSSIFNINGLFFLIFPPQFAYWLMMFLQRLIAGYFTYKLIRETLKLGYFPAFISGMLYSIFNTSINGSFTLYNQLGDPSIPFLLWIIEKCINEKNSIFKKIAWASILGSLFGYISTFALSTPFVIPFIIVWFTFIRKMSLRKIIPFISVFSIWIIIIQFPTIIATVLNANSSHRTFWIIETPSFKSYLKNIILIFIGNHKLPFLISILVLTGAIYYSFTNEIKRIIKFSFYLGKDNKIFSIFLISKDVRILISNILKFYFLFLRRLLINPLIRLLILTFICAVIFPLYQFIQPLLVDYIGFFSNIGLQRFSNFSPLLITASCAYAIDHLLYWKVKIISASRKTYSIITLKIPLEIVIVLIILAQTINIYSKSIKEFLPYSLIFNNSVLKSLKDIKNNDYNKFVSIINSESPVLHPTYLISYGLDISDGYVSLYSKRYHDYWGLIMKHTSKDLDYKNKLLKFNNWGNRIYLFLPSKISEKAPVVFSEFFNLDLLSLSGVKYLVSYFHLEDARIKLLDSQLNRPSNSILDTIGKKLIYSPKKDINQIPINIYENEQAFPKFFMVKNLIIFKNKSDLLIKLASSKTDDFKQGAFVVENDVINIKKELLKEETKKTSGIERVTPEFYSPDRITFNLNLNDSRILILLNNFSQYWRAKVNNMNTAIFPVYHTFQGIYLPPGENEIVIEYKPPYLWTNL